MTTIRRKTIAGLKVGDRFCVRRTFTAEDVAAFARLSRDDNPVHSSDKWVEAKGFDGKICHGLLVAAMVTEIGGQIGWLASGMRMKFKKPVYFGETICCRFTIGAIDAGRRARADVVYTNAQGETVLEAELTGILPGAEEVAALAAMLAEEEALPPAGK